MLTDRLEKFNLRFEKNSHEAQPYESYYSVKQDNRLLVGNVFQSFPPTSSHTISRLGEDCNLEWELLKNLNIPVDHPLHELRDMLFRLVTESISFASNVIDGDINRLQRCLSVEIFVASSPNFSCCGALSMMMSNIMRMLFEPDDAPLVTTVGVSVLPMKSIMMGRFEYITA